MTRTTELNRSNSISIKHPNNLDNSFINYTSLHNSHLLGVAPDVLEEAVLRGQTVQRIVRLAHGADETRQGVRLEGVGDAAGLVNVGDVNLDGSVVLGSDESTSGRAVIISRDFDCIA